MIRDLRRRFSGADVVLELLALRGIAVVLWLMGMVVSMVVIGLSYAGMTK